MIGAALATASVVATLLILEVAARLLLPPPYDVDPTATDVHALNYLRCDPAVGWLGRPNFRGVIDSPVFKTEIAANSEGMHDTEHSLQKPASVFRILMLGDSFVQGFQVDEPDSAHQVLEDMLNENAPTDNQFEVLSCKR